MLPHTRSTGTHHSPRARANLDPTGRRSCLKAKNESTTEGARRFGEEIGIDWSNTPFDVEQLRIGMNVELEHGRHGRDAVHANA